MSGGTFDYIQYQFDNIINIISDEIERATCERPEKIRERAVNIMEIISNSCKMGRYNHIDDLNDAIDILNRQGYIEVAKSIDENERITIIMSCPDKNDIEIVEFWYEHYPNYDYYPEYTEKTLQEFKNGIEIIKKAQIYLQRIDWLIAGDDSEDSFHIRLKEDLNEIRNI